MSGGVGPANDIDLPTEEISENTTTFSKKETPPQAKTGCRSFSSFQQLNALVIAVVLSASGMISVEVVFVLFSFIYMYFISKAAFPPTSPDVVPPVFAQKNKIRGLYVFVEAIIGLFLPIAYIFEGICEGDTEGIKADVPHVFLLASQVFTGVALSGRFSPPMRVYVPVIYNSVRIFTIMDWLSAEISKQDQGYVGSARSLYIGRALAVANLAFWCFNLFGFLLPIYLPKVFKSYYSSTGHKVKD